MINLDILSLIIFVLILSVILYKNKKRAEFQKLLFPVVYMFLFRTKFGLKAVDKVVEKHRETIKFLGYCFIGLSFTGLLYISYSIIATMVKFFFAPAVVDTGVQLVLPGSTIPGIGYLSFWHWLISLFVLVIVHEFSHAVVARAHGLKIKSSGFAVLGIIAPIFPAAFVEPDEKEMAKKSDTIQYSIFSAGPIANLLLALVFGTLLFSVFIPLQNGFYEQDGIEIIDVNISGPAYAAGVRNSTIVTLVDGHGVGDMDDFVSTFEYCIEPEKEMTIGNETDSFSIIPTNRNSKAYIGVMMKNNIAVKDGMENSAKTFEWFKDLVMWLFLLNLFIGLANLLPIFITDGAQMLKLMLEKTMTDKKKAFRAWKIVNALFLALLLIGLLATYIKQLIGLIF